MTCTQCDRPAHTAGMCRGHYLKHRRSQLPACPCGKPGLNFPLVNQ